MASERDLLSEVLPRYDIRDEIGRGGWGVVYEGWHRDLQRRVAIKQLPQHFGTDPDVRDRFIAEAQLVASLEHPHIVPVYDFAERNGLYVIVMELASGGTVWQRFSTQGMHTAQAVGTVLAAAAGLHHAHSRGLLHRDVKPDNMLYSASGTVKIADFGIAKSMTATQVGRSPTEGVIGTPAYMAPEQVTGGELSAATDVYALGAVLFEMLSGTLPFPAAPDAVAQLFQRVHQLPVPLQSVAPSISAPIATVVDRALSREAADRPATAEQFAVDLATAATQTFGAGWLDRSGVTVMGSTAVIGATERASGPAAVSQSSSTVVVRPDDTARLRLTAAPATVSGPAPTADAGVTGQAAGASGPSTMRTWLLGGAAALAAAVIAVLLLIGGDDPVVDPVSDPADVTEVAEITAAERASFVERCESGGVAPRLCRCAADRSIEQLDPATFRAGLTEMLDGTGNLLPELKDIFDTCVSES